MYHLAQSFKGAVMTIQHNVLHQFAAGFNNDSGVSWPAIPFQTPGQQGWKIAYEPFGRGYALADGVKWESIVESSGTVAYGVNGVVLTTDNADNSSGFLGWATANLMIGAATKKFYLETQMTATAATMAGSEIYVGLSSLQGTTIGDFVAADGLSWAMDDGFGIGKLDAETSMSLIANQSDVEQTVSFGSNPTTAVSQVWAVYYDGVNYKLYLNGTEVADTPKVVFNDDAPMTFVSYLRAGTAELQNLLVNYVLFAYEI